MSNIVRNIFSGSAFGDTHYFFYLQPYQVNRLRHLRQTVNSLFQQSPPIGIVDLLYAVLWKRVSALQDGNSFAVLTVIEQEVDSIEVVAENLVKNMFVCSAEILSQQSPVSIAQHIRNYIDSGDSLSRYEEKAADSSPAFESESGKVKLHYSNELICTTLSLPVLQRAYTRCRTINHAYSYGAHRVCSVNSIPQQDGALSVDMRLPRSEIARFKFRYGDAHTVPPAFYEN
jgi:hypothetical protein